MNEVIVGFLILAFGFAFGWLITEALAACEASLPRNQHCKITAVVDEGSDGFH